MKHAIVFITFLTLITSPFTALAGEHPDQPFTAQSTALHAATLRYAAMDAEQKERELEHQLAPIQSRNQLSEYLKTHLMSSLSALTPGAKRRFIQSLVFTEKGLGSYDYSDLRIELTATQIYKLLALFGVQRTTALIPNIRIENPTDQLIIMSGEAGALRMCLRSGGCANTVCAGPGTCAQRANSICVWENCG